MRATKKKIKDICVDEESNKKVDELENSKDASNPPKEHSGLVWVNRFPTSISTDDLTPAFKSNVDAFITAIRKAGGRVSIGATYRPAERAYLMHYAVKVANRTIKPEDVPAKESVNIEWNHGNYEASINAAKEMVRAYQIRYPVSLTSRHVTRQAIDMTITDHIGLTIKNKKW